MFIFTRTVIDFFVYICNKDRHYRYNRHYSITYTICL